MLREVWPFVDAHHRAGRPVVLARLVARDGPGARPLGATMAIAADGTWCGSLSGGCVEAIVVEAARAVLDGTAPPHLTTVTPGGDLLPWETAPACTAALHVLIAPAPAEPVHTAITTALADDQPLTVHTGLRPPYPWTLTPEDPHAFTEHLPRRRRLVLAGATDLAAALATLAQPLHRNVIVVDPRPGHTSSGAVTAATVVRAWPDAWIAAHPLDATDAVIAVSHDPRIDDRALRAALAGNAGHIAALGSRATHVQRLQRLAGTPGLHRLIGPAGLDLGATTLAETALSLLAGVVATENDRTGRLLRDTDTPIRAQADGS
ncbi:XdhC family protein [Jidongwangia harbinensis]|uniref:XdhC family protein n=1 Tax=Jidongwangia harbinensis TaxID=2878561 RepID=UPI001CD92786|nr:XdhC family protein [Jidongwangia harbinensis]MCA2215743.1 XdhC family protein [Jidongwangia harbinensis]